MTGDPGFVQRFLTGDPAVKINPWHVGHTLSSRHVYPPEWRRWLRIFARRDRKSHA